MRNSIKKMEIFIAGQPYLKIYDDVLTEMGCREMKEPAKDNCIIKAQKEAEKQFLEYKKQYTCNSIVYHIHKVVGGTFRRGIRCRDNDFKMRIYRKYNMNCVVFANPTLMDAIAFRSIESEQVIALCVRAEDCIVSEDVENPLHPMFVVADSEKLTYHEERMVTLKEYREKRLNYKIPEVVIPGSISREQILGVYDRRDAILLPWYCEYPEE